MSLFKGVIAALAVAIAAPACAVGRIADLTVYDRTEGRRLPVHWHQGRAYVVGKPGNEYQVSLRNRQGDDVLAIVAVDGVNVVTGETASPSQSGYVLSPGGAMDILGWRKSLSETAAFYFTSLPDSYAARTGRPDNVGVIGVALYRKKVTPPPAPIGQQPFPAPPPPGPPPPRPARPPPAPPPRPRAPPARGGAPPPRLGRCGQGGAARHGAWPARDLVRAVRRVRARDELARRDDHALLRQLPQPGGARHCSRSCAARTPRAAAAAVSGVRSGPGVDSCAVEAPDEQLMLAYGAGNAAAFETLYTRHRGRLYRFVLRSVKARGTAEELFQEIWMRVIEARSRYTPQARFTTWLYTIAHNLLTDHWRRKGLALVELDEDAHAAAPDDPARSAEARQALARFAAALEALPPLQRQAFLMHEEGGLSLAEIAQATGSNEEAAKSRLRYAMAKLKAAADG